MHTIVLRDGDFAPKAMNKKKKNQKQQPSTRYSIRSCGNESLPILIVRSTVESKALAMTMKVPDRKGWNGGHERWEKSQE